MEAKSRPPPRIIPVLEPSHLAAIIELLSPGPFCLQRPTHFHPRNILWTHCRHHQGLTGRGRLAHSGVPNICWRRDDCHTEDTDCGAESQNFPAQCNDKHGVTFSLLCGHQMLRIFTSCYQLRVRLCAQSCCSEHWKITGGAYLAKLSLSEAARVR
jgi:hypothetical protein